MMVFVMIMPLVMLMMLMMVTMFMVMMMMMVVTVVMIMMMTRVVCWIVDDKCCCWHGDVWFRWCMEEGECSVPIATWGEWRCLMYLVAGTVQLPFTRQLKEGIYLVWSSSLRTMRTSTSKTSEC